MPSGLAREARHPTSEPAMRIPHVILTLGLIVHAGALASAQQPAVAAGTKVRFELRSGNRVEGRVISLGPEGLEASLPVNGAATRYPLSEIAKLEVVQGRYRPVLRGVLVGTGAGLVVGGAIGAMTYEPCESTEFLGCLLEPESRAQSAAMGAVVLGALGLVVGGVQGMIPRDRWQRVHVDGNVVRFNMRALPRNGTGIGLALAF
jgi:hypothetical protein